MMIDLHNNTKGLAVLTKAGSKYGLKVLEKLADYGIKPKILCIEKDSFYKRIKRAKFLYSKIGLVDTLRYNIRFWANPIVRLFSFGFIYPNPNYSNYSDNIFFASDINERKVSQLLSNGIDRILLAQSGIIRSEILELKNCNIINCHPGDISYFRGVDCVKWSLYCKKKIIISLHLIDSGIDTGPVIEKKVVPIKENDTIKGIEERADNMCVELLVSSIFMQDEFFCKAKKNVDNKGKQYYLMPSKIRKELFEIEKQIILELCK